MRWIVNGKMTDGDWLNAGERINHSLPNVTKTASADYGHAVMLPKALVEELTNQTKGDEKESRHH